MSAARPPRALRQRRRPDAAQPVRRPMAGDRSQRGRGAAGSGGRLVSAPGERCAGADGCARRQRGVHVHVVRGRGGRRKGRGPGRRTAAAPRDDGGRHRAPELRTIHRHQRVVRPSGGHYEVRIALHVVNVQYYCSKNPFSILMKNIA